MQSRHVDSEYVVQIRAPSAGSLERPASYKVPRAFVFAADEEIPRTDTGKVKLDALSDFIARRLAEGKSSS